MKLHYWFATCLFSVTAASVAAVAPSQQKVIREITVQASPEKSWAVIKDFASIANWHPAVATVKLEMRKDDTGTEVQHRLITLKDGGTLLEKLSLVSDADMKMEYRIVEGVLPVSSYRSVMQVKPGAQAGQSVVTWTGRFYNKAYAVDAPAGEDNATAIQAVEGVYDSGMAGLKTLLESK